MTMPGLPALGQASGSRVIENVLALVGVAIGGAYVILAEALPASGLLKCGDVGAKGFPWGVLAIVLACILPKTLGRLTAGRIWASVANRLGGGGAAPPAAP